MLIFSFFLGKKSPNNSNHNFLILIIKNPCMNESHNFIHNKILFMVNYYPKIKYSSKCDKQMKTTKVTQQYFVVGLAYQGKDIMFRFIIIEYSSLRDIGP